MAGKRGPGRPPGSKNKKYKGNNRETMALDGVVNGSEAGSTGSGRSGSGKSGSKSGGSGKGKSGGKNGGKSGGKGTGSKGSGKGSGSKSTGSGAGNSARGAASGGYSGDVRKRVPNEITSIIILAIGVFLVIAFQTDVAGAFGEIVSDFFKGIFGLGAYTIPYLLIIYAVLMLIRMAPPWKWTTLIWMFVFVMGLDLFNAGRFVAKYKTSFPSFTEIYHMGGRLENGGLFGTYAGGGLYRAAGGAGLYIVAVVLILIGFILLFKTTIKIIRNGVRERKGYYDDDHYDRKAEKKAEKARLKEAEREAAAAAAADQSEDMPQGEQMQIDYPAPKVTDEDEMIRKIKEDQRRQGFLERMGFNKQKEIARSGSGEQPPKWPRKIPANQKDILNMVWTENDFGPSEQKDGFGLDGSQESLHQKRNFNAQNDAMFTGMYYGSDYHEGADDPEAQGRSFAPDDRMGDHVDGSGFGLPDDYRSGLGLPEIDSRNLKGGQGFGDRKLDTIEFERFIKGQDTFGNRAAGTAGAAVSEGTADPGNDEGRRAGSAAGTAGTADAEQPQYEVGGESVATAKSKTEEGGSDVSVTPSKRGRYKMPPLELLRAPSVDEKSRGPSEDLNAKAQLLEETLKSFNVDAKVVNVISGPSVTRYEIQPAIGVKVSRITSLSDDIALNMRANSIRIEAPIPGKAAVGIEIENANRQMVTMREIIGSSAFKNSKSKLAFTVGRDIGGNPVVADLAKMPHLLIAGATGSGKSVCINSIIASILYKARPEEVKMILVDPKMVELGNYNGIPHLLIPVVTDASKAASALNWAVAEMTDRYKKFASNGVRDIGSYNQLMKDKGAKEEILPQVVIIIDELSDLMMVASSQVEDAICRLAQLARAAGMHLVIATQRPSVDVITGLIKANIPSRIALVVSSQIDSRTIIDMPGAEKLVGNGDMLYKPQDLNKPKRIQGPYISDSEIARLIDYIKEQGKEAEYDQEIINQIEKGKDFSGSDDGDELLADAVGVVVNAGQASVSMLQRRFRIGYNRAARIVDIMEQRGIVGPPDGARPRQVLISEAEYDNMKEEGVL